MPVSVGQAFSGHHGSEHRLLAAAVIYVTLLVLESG